MILSRCVKHRGGSDQLGRGGLVQTSMGTTLMRMEWQRFLPLLIVYKAALLSYEFCLFYGLREPLTVEFVSDTGIFSSVLLYNFYLLLSMFLIS